MANFYTSDRLQDMLFIFSNIGAFHDLNYFFLCITSILLSCITFSSRILLPPPIRYRTDRFDFFPTNITVAWTHVAHSQGASGDNFKLQLTGQWLVTIVLQVPSLHFQKCKLTCHEGAKSKTSAT